MDNENNFLFDIKEKKLNAGLSWWEKGSPDAPVAWYGGKRYYAKWIIEHFTDHRIFVEPFGGAANILLRKCKSQVEIYNDLDGRIVNFFKVIRKKKTYEEFIRLSSLTPYSRQVFSELVNQKEPRNKVDAAWWFFVRCRQSIGGLGMSKLSERSWSASTRTRRSLPEGVSKYLSAVDGLEQISERLKEVMIECLPATEVVAKYDSAETLFYIDPPYLPETRHGGKASTYAVEMSYEQHEELLNQLDCLEAKILISGYDSDLYGSHLKSWRREEMEGKSHISNSGQKRTEVLWMNW